MQETKEKRIEARNKLHLVEDIKVQSHFLFDILNKFLRGCFRVLI